MRLGQISAVGDAKEQGTTTKQADRAETEKPTIRRRVLQENAPYSPRPSSKWDDRVKLTLTYQLFESPT